MAFTELLSSGSGNLGAGGNWGLGPYPNKKKPKLTDKDYQRLKAIGFFDDDDDDDSSVVDVEGVEEKIDSAGSSGGGNEGDQSTAPTTNADADRLRNQQSNMTALLQQHGINKIPLDPVGGAVIGGGLGLTLSKGKLLPAALGAGAGYLLGRSNSILLPKGKKSFDESQAVEGSQPVENSNEGALPPLPELRRDEVTTESGALSQEKADISGMYPNQSAGGLEIAPKLANADENRANAFSDPITLLAQSAKTTTEDDFDPAFNSNMQPQVGGEAGLEATWDGGSPGNVVSPADELVASFTKRRVPEYLARTLGGGSIA